MANSLEMVGGLLVEVDVSSVDKAIAKLKQLEQSVNSLTSNNKVVIASYDNTGIAAELAADRAQRAAFRKEDAEIKAAKNAEREQTKSVKAAEKARVDAERSVEKAAKDTAKEIAKAAREADAAANSMAYGARNISNAFGIGVPGLNQLTTGLTQLSGLANVAIFGGIAAAIFGIGKAAYDAYQPIQSLSLALKNMGESPTLAIEQLRSTANRLGVEFQSIIKPTLQWKTAIEGTKLEGEAGQKVFDSLVGAMKATGASSEDVERGLKAITQMLSKGTVQSEELKGQLGDAFPAAFKTAAEAMEVSTSTLMDMMKKGLIDSTTFLIEFEKVLRQNYGGAVQDAANTTQSEINRAKNAWSELSAHIGREVDGIVGKILQFMNAQRQMEGFAGEFRREYIRGEDKFAADRIGITPEQLAQIRLDQFTKSGGTIPRWARVNGEGTAVGIAAALQAGIKDLPQRDQQLLSAITNATNKPADQYFAEKAKAEAERQQQAKDAADRAAKSRRLIAAKETGDPNEVLRQQLENKRQDIKRMEGMKGFDSTSPAYLKLLEEEATIKSQLKRGSQASVGRANNAANKANNDAEYATRRMEDILGQGTSYKDAITNRIKNLDDPNGLAGTLSAIEEQYDKLIGKVKTEKNLTADQKKDAEERLETMKKEAVEEERKLNDAKKRAAFESDIAKYREHAFNAQAREQQNRMTFQFERKQSYDNMMEGLGTPGVVLSKYAKARNDFIKAHSDEKSYKERVLKLQGEQLKLDDEYTKAREKARKDKGLSEFAELHEEDKKIADAMNYNQQKKKYEAEIASTQKAQGRRQIAVLNAYNEDYVAKHKLSYGVNSGAGEYIDSIKSKAERAHDATVLLGQSLTSVFMANSSSQALDSGKGFFKSLLVMIRQTIVELKIVKPLIDAIQTSAGKEGGFLNTMLNGAGDWVGKYFGSGSAKPVVSEGTSQISGEFMASLFAANGAAFGSGVRYFASGGVFDRPTAFQYGANNLGILGEAGPEAILPLKRNSRGALGVQMEGVSNQSQTITIAPVINISGNATREDADIIARQTTEQMRAVVREELMKSNRPGGQNYRK